jgi:hypothetical protein
VGGGGRCVPKGVREPYDRTSVPPISKLHALTIMAAEQQTMNFYMNVGPEYMEPIARQLYQEIGLIEEEHVTHYESLIATIAGSRRRCSPRSCPTYSPSSRTRVSCVSCSPLRST